MREESKKEKERKGKARQGKARQGKTRQGNARQGKARQGKARQGKERQGEARQGKARKGKERQGKARKGMERQGKARKGKERKGKERKGNQRKGQKQVPFQTSRTGRLIACVETPHSDQHGNDCACTNKSVFLSVYVDDINMVGKAQNLRRMWKSLKEEIDLEDPTPLTRQVYLGCTQSAATVNADAVQSKAGLLKRLTTAEETEEKDLTKEPFVVATDHCLKLRHAGSR